ncbi:GH32 C-terminal domain-containing protein [Streptococcus orisasini]|uniref:GH32 C-terminal domain-containing protein n=1 Tax=Streptococcus orisasini TaxID=1080071 RepID=UPI00070E047C|nr:GH32 C-terminal domain-containing protein [Streptococcus orisasini]
MKKETVCKNWFMRKSGKSWLFGCSVLFVLGMATTLPAAAEENGPVTAADVAVTEEGNKNEVQALPQEAPVTEAIQASDAALNQAAVTEATTIQVSVPENTEPTAPVTSADSPNQAAEKETPHLSPANPEVKEEPVAQQEIAAKKEENNSVTNLKDVTHDNNGSWEINESGIHSNAVGKGDSFLYSQSSGKNFIYAADVIFKQNSGAAALIFRGNNDSNHKNMYAVNVDVGGHKAKLWRWVDNKDIQLIDERDVVPTADNRYTLKVVAVNKWISYYVNDVLMASTGDYVLQKTDKGQNTVIPEGYFGLLNWNGDLVFQNIKFTLLDDATIPLIDNVTVTSDKGHVEKQGQFFSEEPLHIQYVSNDAAQVGLDIVKHNPAALITVEDEAGHVYTDLSHLPVKVGANYFTIKSTITDQFGRKAILTYRINVHRRQKEDVYYNELYRDQYHYSVKDGWANDPNGMVYYKGVYHLFHQFYDDTKWGPMHWAHATSTDLIHWKEEPIAFYPDSNGYMFSGCVVIDDHNSSGFFKTDKGGLVAIITANGNGQRMELAYSEDEGKTWQKYDKIVADWSNDPLQSQDFRDPKVFRWNNQWFMVLAGGPLRIYSSNNLKDWKVESTYPDLHTECPDMYPIIANDGVLKWVLSRGGRFYKVGDFKQVAGKWTFVADAAYKDKDEVMNFGKDSYAAMTYYVQDFGTERHPTIPKLTEINWMNTWEDYCNLVADTVGQNFNGTFNLNLDLGLINDNGRYVLTQTPVKAYDSLRETDTALHFKDVTVDANNTLLKDFKGDSYEIVSKFRPDAKTTKVGFNLRVGNGQATKVIYDLQTETLSIDRSQSGIILSDAFAKINSQHVTKNADGSIDLHLYVDRASLEVFAKGNTVAGANQIFPNPEAVGASVIVEGGKAQADISVYKMKTTWTDKKDVTKPVAMNTTTATNLALQVGQVQDLQVYLAPASVKQDVKWTVSDPSLVKTSQTGNVLHLTAVKKGNLTVTATSTENPSLSKTFTIAITLNNFKTNLKGLKSVVGNWYIDDETLYDSNTSANDYYMATQKPGFKEYDYDIDLKYQNGLINLFVASENIDPGQAYSVQFGDSENVRLYRYGGDTIAEANMGKRINDGQYHHIKVSKKANSMIIFVDGQEVMNHTFDQVDSYFNDAYVGLGLWDGAVEFQNFFVTDHNKAPEPDPSPKPQPDAPEVLEQERELIDPLTDVHVILQKGESSSIVGLQTNHIETNDVHTPDVLQSKDYDLFNITLVDKDGKAVAVTKSAIVLLPIDSGKMVDKVVYLPNTSKEEILPFTIVSLTDSNGKKQDYVRFMADHFSEYGLVYRTENRINPQKNGKAEEANDVSHSSSSSSQQEFKTAALSQKRSKNVTNVKALIPTAVQKVSLSSAAMLPNTGDHKTNLSQLGLLAVLGGCFAGIVGYFKKRSH